MDRNVPAADIRKWNVLNAMRSVAVSWKSTVPVVFQYCFAKCGFGTVNEVSSEEDEGSEWMDFQGDVDCPSIFSEFLSVENSKHQSGSAQLQVCGSVGDS
jgi:hypothetical protein